MKSPTETGKKMFCTVEYVVLNLLLKGKPLSPGDFIDFIGADKSIISRVLKGLRDAGFITEDGKAHGRNKFYKIPKNIRKHVKQMMLSADAIVKAVEK